ncbi:MAG: tetratricopeptide (TPR) repeat protein [Myxococcota bacterium]|jgi:tetratricopeptide (TPR) repeat protein
MDQRLQIGRELLASGDESLRRESIEHARRHFQAALLQFRGPELRLGEAHALRGLAEVARRQGSVQDAEAYVDASILGYRATRDALAKVDPRGVARELWDEATSGECSALVLLSSLQLRIGNDGEARRTLSLARDLATHLGGGGAAGVVWATLGRAALRDGNYLEARASLERAESIHGGAGEVAAALGCALTVAEIDRLTGSTDAAAATLARVASTARSEGLSVLEGRADSALAGLAGQAGDYARAAELYSDALTRLRTADDRSPAAYAMVGLGDARSRLAAGPPGDASQLASAAQLIVEGLARFRETEQLHGMGVGLLRLGQHARRAGADDLALALGEAARRVLVRTDPTRGVGEALRLQVKAAAGVSAGSAVLALAWARADLVGHSQPKAREVFSFYKARAPIEWVERLKRLDEAERVATAARITERVLHDVLGEIGCSLAALDDLGQAGPLFDAVLALGTPE